MQTTLVQRGFGHTPDLFVWVMGDIDGELKTGAPKDTIVKLYNGAGTSKYEVMPTVEQVINTFHAPYKTVTLSGWSAGGRGVQRMLDFGLYQGGRLPEAVLIADGLYAPLVGQKADKRPLRSIIDYATRAALGQCTCILWHSDIKTPGYASSRLCVDAVIEEVEKNTGRRLESWSSPAFDGRSISASKRIGDLYILRYAGQGKAEHVAEAKMVDDVMRAMLPWASDENGVDPSAAPPWRDPCRTIGERAVAWSEHQRELGVHEVPAGSNTGPEIRGYLDPCVREAADGTLKRLGLKAAKWCAASSCAAEVASLLPGETASTPYRCSGIELERDFTRVGRFHWAEELRSGAWVPSVGDILLLHRGTEKWERHVVRIKGLVEGGVTTIGGNENDRWGPDTLRHFTDADIVGVGELPRGTAACEPADVLTSATPEARENLLRLDELVALAMSRLHDMVSDQIAEARPR